MESSCVCNELSKMAGDVVVVMQYVRAMSRL